MQNNNLILTFNELYEFFKEHDYHITRASLPFVSDNYLSEATYYLTYGVGMKDALTKIETGDIQTYNALDKKILFDHPMPLSELLNALTLEQHLDVTTLQSLLNVHKETLNDLNLHLCSIDTALNYVTDEHYDTLEHPYFVADSFRGLLSNLLSQELSDMFLKSWGTLLDSIICFTTSELIPLYQTTPDIDCSSDFYTKLVLYYTKLQLLTGLCNFL